MKEKKTTIFIILTILWICVIWGHSLMPASASTEESSFFLDLLASIIPISDMDLGMTLIRKLAHFTEYAILAILLTVDFHNLVKDKVSKVIFPLFSGLLTAQIDETIQLFVEGRSGQVTDVWIDFAGVCFAAAITCVIMFKRQRNN